MGELNVSVASLSSTGAPDDASGASESANQRPGNTPRSRATMLAGVSAFI